MVNLVPSEKLMSDIQSAAQLKAGQLQTLSAPQAFNLVSLGQKLLYCIDVETTPRHTEV